MATTIEIKNENVEKFKEHVKKYKEAYITAGVSLAVITCLIVRSRSDFSISRGISVAAKRGPAVPEKTSVNALEVNRGGLVLGNIYALNNVSFISSNRQGPPSWVVRCLETGGIFASQNSAAIEMELSSSELSKHLNGVLDNVQGFRFERVCMAA